MPIYIKTTAATKVSKVKINLDENCAKELVDRELQKLLEAEDLEVLSINKQYKTENNTLTMVCTVYCIENIALEMPMTGVPIE